MTLRQLGNARARRKQIQPIRDAYLRSGWSQAKLAREAGVTIALVSLFHHEQIASMYTAGRLALALVGFYEAKQCG